MMSSMIGPHWLAAIFGVLMLASTVYAIIRIVVSVVSRKATDYSIEICHGLMGLSMAGMLIPGLGIVQPGASTIVWIILSALVTVWFIVSAVSDLVVAHPERVDHVRRLHHLPHIVLSGAMVYMLAAMAMMGTSSHGPMSGSSAMSMHMTMNSLVPGATLDLVLALFMFGYTVLLIDRLPFVATHGIGRPRAWGRSGASAELYAPRGAALLGIVMSASMGYMLVMMFV